MDHKIPDYLLSTFNMLKSAYPAGIPPNEYLPLLRLLYEEMSDRNLALTVGLLIGTDAPLVLNDIYRAAAEMKLESSEVQKVRKKLSQYGYEEWLKEE